jgi:hypothetical protein
LAIVISTDGTTRLLAPDGWEDVAPGFRSSWTLAWIDDGESELLRTPIALALRRGNWTPFSPPYESVDDPKAWKQFKKNPGGWNGVDLTGWHDKENPPRWGYSPNGFPSPAPYFEVPKPASFTSAAVNALHDDLLERCRVHAGLWSDGAFNDAQDDLEMMTQLFASVGMCQLLGAREPWQIVRYPDRLDDVIANNPGLVTAPFPQFTLRTVESSP